MVDWWNVIFSKRYLIFYALKVKLSLQNKFSLGIDIVLSCAI